MLYTKPPIFTRLPSSGERNVELSPYALYELILCFFEKSNVKGIFSIHKSRRYMSVLVVDEEQEPNNAVFKGDGGAIGLTE